MASRQVPGKDNESSGRGKRGWVWRPVRSRGRITRAGGGEGKDTTVCPASFEDTIS